MRENRVNSQTALPFLKWAGGKRWLVGSKSSTFPSQFGKYYEPFLGSGAVFFHLGPQDAVISDINSELIEAYNAIKDNWKKVYYYLKKHHKYHCKNYYYKIRSARYREPFRRAARLIYLNRTCWNGLYRVNLDGDFNVPIGTKTNVILKSDDFEVISNLLRDIDVISCDFEDVVDRAEADDLIYLDPPYTVKHNNNGFRKYNEVIFSWHDQIRLRDSLFRANRRGAKIILSNADSDAVTALYKGFGTILRRRRSSVIAADSNNRKIETELLITNL